MRHHTFKEIVENQKKFKNQILDFFGEEQSFCISEIVELEKNTNDALVQDRIKSLKKKIKEIRKKDYERLLFSSKNKSEKYYAWWDIKQEQTIIYEYKK